jgi:hypothetical protein
MKMKHEVTLDKVRALKFSGSAPIQSSLAEELLNNGRGKRDTVNLASHFIQKANRQRL